MTSSSTHHPPPSPDFAPPTDPSSASKSPKVLILVICKLDDVIIPLLLLILLIPPLPIQLQIVWNFFSLFREITKKMVKYTKSFLNSFYKYIRKLFQGQYIICAELRKQLKRFDIKSSSAESRNFHHDYSFFNISYSYSHEVIKENPKCFVRTKLFMIINLQNLNLTSQ